MIIENLIQDLRDDATVSGYVGTRIEAYSTGTTDDSIVFNFSPVSDDKISRVDKMELHIISTDIVRMYAIHEACKTVLLTFGDDRFDGDILEVNINGGGTLEELETGTYHHITYYYIRSKSHGYDK